MQMRHRIGDDGQPGGKTRDFHAHAAAPSRAARLRREDESLDRALIRRQHGDALRPRREDRRASRAMPGARRRRPRPRRGISPDARSTARPSARPVARFLLGDRDRHRGVRIDADSRPRARTVRMVAAVSSSSARSAEKCARIRASAAAAMAKRRDCASEPISARTARASRP